MLYSFDVFDTLITRKTITPEGVFALMQKRLKNSVQFEEEFIAEFVDIRIQAERNAWMFYSEREVTLKDIYFVMERRYHLNHSQLEELMSLEIECEKQCVIPICQNIDRLKQLLFTNERVVLISDMYLPEKNIREILCEVDEVFSELKLYVSCELGVSKRNGLLYAEVKKREKADYSNWIHYGDNIASDYNAPQLYGINAVHIGEYERLPIENAIFHEFGQSIQIEMQFFLGLIKELFDDKKSIMYRYGTICGGSILVPYVEWILSECERNNIGRLLFVSRDGYILKKIADFFISEKRVNIETMYVYGSRDVWRMTDGCDLSIEYLKQCIGGERQDFAFVDFNGSGRAIGNMAKKMQVKCRTFYYSFNGNPVQEWCEFHPYTYVVIKSPLLEVFCRAPHGGVIGYERNDEKISPVLQAVDDTVWEKSGLYEYIDGVLDFVRLYNEEMNILRLKINFSKIGQFVINYCEFTPDLLTVQVIGDFPHGRVNCNEITGYAPALSDFDIKNLYSQCEDENINDYYKGADIEYSMKRMSDEQKELMAQLEKEKVVHSLNSENRKKIIVYAAGKYGKEAVYRILHSNDKCLVGWTDINYQAYNDKQVESLSILKTRKYDCILIAVASKGLFEKIRNMLISIGIDEKCIVWMKEIWLNLD